MLETFFAFIERHQSFILTTHDPADADGLGSELVFSAILKNRGKLCRIINAGPVPENFSFMDARNTVEQWDPEIHQGLPEKSALLMLDTSDEYNIGVMREVITRVREVFVIDHHEPTPHSALAGITDPGAAATCELAVEAARAAGLELDPHTARAAYAGLVCDTGFFAYSKTGRRTFLTAIALVDAGVIPNEIFRQVSENAATGALLLQKRVLASLELHHRGKVATQVLRKEDLAATGARFEDAEGFINIPMRVREIAVSVLVKETPEGNVRCSLRSKGKVNVSKIAQDFGGGGHISAAGFRSGQNIEETLKAVIRKVSAQLDKV